MCLACIEYLKGNLADSEFKRNLREFKMEEHDLKALEMAEIPKDFFEEINSD